MHVGPTCVHACMWLLTRWSQHQPRGPACRCYVGNLGYLVAAETLGSNKAPQLLAQEVLCRRYGNKEECEGSSETAPVLVHAGAEATV